MYTLKTNNRHAPHPVNCAQCGRKLRRNAHNEVCASCRKEEKRLQQVKNSQPEWREHMLALRKE